MSAKGGPPPGVNSRKPDKSICAAVGCERKALYATTRGRYGFCATHKGLAVRRWAERTVDSFNDHMISRWGIE